MNVITRNVPATYELQRIAFQLNSANDIEATADLMIRNANGRIIDDDHPDTVLSPGEESTFKAWVLAQLADYESSTGLTRYVPPVEKE